MLFAGILLMQLTVLMKRKICYLIKNILKMPNYSGKGLFWFLVNIFQRSLQSVRLFCNLQPYVSMLLLLTKITRLEHMLLHIMSIFS